MYLLLDLLSVRHSLTYRTVRMKLELEKCRCLLDPQGGIFREIHLLSWKATDRATLLKYLRVKYPDLHSVSGTEDISGEYRDAHFPLYFTYSGLGFYCHSKEGRSLEFAFDVREVSDQAALDGLCDVITGLARAVSADAIITPENLVESVLCRYRLEDDEFSYSGGK